jgi:hypothetical protein
MSRISIDLRRCLRVKVHNAGSGSLMDYMRMIEDLADLAVAAERRDEPVIDAQKFVEELKRDGLLPS